VANIHSKWESRFLNNYLIIRQFNPFDETFSRNVGNLPPVEKIGNSMDRSSAALELDKIA
jgi:hypothetical protein